MKTLIIGLFFLLLLPFLSQATITQRIIHAGDTPLFSDCAVTQTGPMELSVATCRWTTRGEAGIAPKEKVSDLSNKIAAGQAEMMPDGKRARWWLTDNQGNIIDKSRTRVLPPTVLSISAGNTWVVYMVDGPGVTMTLRLQPWTGISPEGVLNYLLMPFKVPAGTTDLNTIDIEVFTVLPGFPAPKGLFEK